jgi:hypothetical protein
MKRAFAFATLLAAAPLMAQTTTPPAPLAVTLPANVLADIAAVQADVTALKAAVAQVREDEKSNSATIAADRTAVHLARLKVRMDAQHLHLDAAPILQADEKALFNALTQLHNDQVGANAGAIAADTAAVTAAQEQLHADMKAIGGGMHHGHGHHRQ